MADNRTANGVDPVLLLLVAVCDEEKVALGRGDFKGMRLVDGVLCPLNGQTTLHLDDPAWHRVLQETQAKVERGGRGGQEKMVFTVGMEQRGGARPLQSVQPPVPGGGGAQVRMRQVSDVFVDPFGHRKTAALNGRLYAEGLERQGCVAWLRTGVTMSDLNQKIFPCLRTNHLLLQVLMYSPCFISQPARSGPCQNSTSPASGFFPKRAFILVCLFPRVCRSRRPRTPSRPEKKDCAKLEV
mmetsp:Transcript_20628/g.57248  ORF Transcript_20628/g.57248 Transcript_20628/m.57248 type:complete len:241 (-) Transcript_20628:85-807(-)